MRLNLGCSTDLRPAPWINVDIATPDNLLVSPGQKVNFERADLALPWPWADSSVDEIYAADIFEHIGDVPRLPGLSQDLAKFWTNERHWSGRIHVMNEAWRVMRPGGLLTMECPDAAKGAGQWQDPTHVTAWTPNGLQYFADGSPAYKRFAAAYGITARFNVLSVVERMYVELAPPTVGIRCDVWKFSAALEAVKNA